MTTPRGFPMNDGYYNTGANFHNLDDMQPRQQRLSSIVLRPHNQEYQPQEYRHQERRNVDRHQTFKSERSTCCSKPCLIGLAIGLGIGVLVVIAIAVPLGVIKRCGTVTLPSTSSTSTLSWLGTFQVDNGCDPTHCCCFTNQITLTQPGNNVIQIAGSVTGQCTGSTSVLTQTIPTGSQTVIIWVGQTILIQLSQDSNYLSFTTMPSLVCSSTALKTSLNAGNIKSMNLVLIIFMLSIIMGIIKR